MPEWASSNIRSALSAEQPMEQAEVENAAVNATETGEIVAPDETKNDVDAQGPVRQKAESRKARHERLRPACLTLHAFAADFSAARLAPFR